MRLFFLLYSIVATALAGTAIVVVLAAGLDGWQPIVAASALGAVLAVAVTWWASKKIATL
jgi:hypothetical protein